MDLSASSLCLSLLICTVLGMKRVHTWNHLVRGLAPGEKGPLA